MSLKPESGDSRLRLSFFQSGAMDFDYQYFIELFASGLTKGSIYALIALGYTMVYGIVGLINFAHGEIYMLGAFVFFLASSLLTVLGLPLWAMICIATAASIFWAGGYGYTVEKIAYKPLRGAPRLSPLISAIGMSVFLQNYVMLGQTEKYLGFPEVIPEFDFLEPFASTFSSSDFVIWMTTVIVMLILTWIIKFTRTGKAMRATAQDRTMAELVGINVNRIISATFIIGSALAAVGGILISSHTGSIHYYIGFIAGIKAFTAAVLGGIGSIPGAVLGGLVLGMAESFATGYFSSAYEDVFAFSLLVLILIFRPAGLLGHAETEKV